MFFTGEKYKNQKKNIDEVGALYEAIKKQLFDTAYAVLHDEGMAEDAVIETMYRLLKNAERIDFKDIYRTRCYANVICRNAAIDMAKKKSTLCSEDESGLSDGETDTAFEPEKILISMESVRRIADIIKNMNPIYSDVLILKQQGLTSKEMAAALNISEAAARKRLMRARKELAERLRREELI